MANIEAMLRQISNDTTARTFAFNHDEAKLSRSFQESMSNTAHQREVNDLKAAGLNPVLSAGGSGAASYSASSASGSADNSSVAALANLYQTRMNNDNARAIASAQNRVAKENKQTDLQIAKINAAASNYASNKAASASRYASDNARYASIYGTDNSRYGALNQFAEGVFGGNAKHTGSLIGKGVNQLARNISNGLKAIFKR